jgi:hypothetical protein
MCCKTHCFRYGKVAGHSSAKSPDAGFLSVKNNGRIYTEDIIKIYFRSMIRSNLWRFHCSCEISRDQ